MLTLLSHFLLQILCIIYADNLIVFIFINAKDNNSTGILVRKCRKCIIQFFRAAVLCRLQFDCLKLRFHRCHFLYQFHQFDFYHFLLPPITIFLFSIILIEFYRICKCNLSYFSIKFYLILLNSIYFPLILINSTKFYRI